ncbi:Gfo/Idh/MocA family oxidoreductase [Flammeovirgaceae bacterium SG7u.111]|nr:Gfo/Idh/MocA family oxidoreductase [Flammeovirgaceae bacterium SG7u.132]WPO36253.1 Gfo/Idh/MocA family oxidoreductase [Flammeovirgaceae bacterium SG7u.111]
MKKKNNLGTSTRRSFIKTTGTAALGSTLAFNIIISKTVYAGNSDTIKVGLIGCGGRGTGAASQALNADDNVVLTAMADIFEDKLKSSLKNLKKELDKKVKVDEDHQFLGFDSYNKLLASDVDMVILATPPAFRPDHLAAAVEARKHIFCEKPMAVDAPGFRKVLESVQKAKDKKLSLVSGFCWRHDFPKQEAFKRVLDGEIGEVRSIYNTYNTGELWSKPMEKGWSEMEYKMRNWLYYNWLSGDHIVEQAIHSVDMMSWAMGDEILPVSCTGTGGRQQRTEEKFGHIYDHFAITYEYENGAKGFHMSRQQKFCDRSYAVDMNGTKGRAIVDCIKRIHRVENGETWNYRGETNNMYQTEHDVLFASIRKGDAVNEGVRMANSTMLGIMGRMAAYTGKTVTWEDAIKSTEVLGPKIDEYSWELEWPTTPVAVPGVTKFF